MTPHSNSNLHKKKKTKSAGEGNYVGKYKRKYNCILLFFSSHLIKRQLHKLCNSVCVCVRACVLLSLSHMEMYYAWEKEHKTGGWEQSRIEVRKWHQIVPWTHRKKWGESEMVNKKVYTTNSTNMYLLSFFLSASLKDLFRWYITLCNII